MPTWKVVWLKTSTYLMMIYWAYHWLSGGGQQVARQNAHYPPWANGLVGKMELNDRQCRGRCLAGVNNQLSRNTKHCPLPPPTPSQSEGFDSRVKKIWECYQLCSMACISHLDGNPQGSKTPSPRQESQRALQWQFPMLQTYTVAVLYKHPTLLLREFTLFPFLVTTPTVLSILLNTASIV